MNWAAIGASVSDGVIPALVIALAAPAVTTYYRVGSRPPRMGIRRPRPDWKREDFVWWPELGVGGFAFLMTEVFHSTHLRANAGWVALGTLVAVGVIRNFWSTFGYEKTAVPSGDGGQSMAAESVRTGGLVESVEWRITRWWPLMIANTLGYAVLFLDVVIGENIGG